MNNFKAPDVVWLRRMPRLSVATTQVEVDTVFTTCKPRPPYNNVYSYTLTTTAEANTRKAVREALEKLRAATRSAQEQAYSLRLDYEKNGDRGEAREMQEHIVAHSLTLDCIDQLLTQYQEPTQPTEASNV